MSMHRSSNRSNRNSGGKGILVVGALVLLAGGGAGAWYFMRGRHAPVLPVAEAKEGTPAPGAQAPKPGEAVVAKDPVKTEPAVGPVKDPVKEPAKEPVKSTTGTPAIPAANSTAPFVPVAVPAALTPQTGNIQKELEQGMALLKANKVVEGRAVLSEVLFNYTAELKPENAAWIRATLTDINNTYAYGKRNLTDDDITAIYTVKNNDALELIANKYRVPSGLLLQISGMKSAKNLQAGQKIKTILGPISARVSKHEYRMDLYTQNANGAKIYLKSFPICLGMDNKTPVGKFRIGVLDGDAFRGKVENSAWTDPETGKHYLGGAADNPIGKFWIPVQGVEPTTASFTGYGIHGTNDPTSIGQNKSHGCIRLVPADIEEVYHTLFCGRSTFSMLEILP